LIGASVWMKPSKVFDPLIFKPERSKAETMPRVTVRPMRNGLPTAYTGSPTRTLVLSANGNVGSPPPSILSSAMSVRRSLPISFAANLRRSVSSTVMASAVFPEANVTTW